MATINKTNAFMEFPLQISRQYSGPIERYSVFYSLEEATTYATTNPIAYVGQIVTVVDEGKKNSVAYQISNVDGYLVEIGASKPMLFVDNESAMLALKDLEAGQQVYREDTSTVWIFAGGDATQLVNWRESAAHSDTIWQGTENKVIFNAITEAAYKALDAKDVNTLYFITDAGRVCKGSADLTKSVIVTDTIPAVADAILDKLYINSTTFEAKITTDNARWIVLTPGYLTDGANWADADSNKFATIGLIKKGIKAAVDAISLATTFDSITGSVKVGEGTAATLTGVAHGITYDASTLTITIPQYGSDNLVVNIPKDKFVTAGKYYEDYPETDPTQHKVIVLTIDGQADPVIIPAEALVNIYSADNTSKNVVISVSDDNKISAQILIDPNTKNALTYSDAGFLVDISGKLDKLTSALGDKIVISDANGNVVESKFSIQSEGELSVSAENIATNNVVSAAIAKKVTAVAGTENNIISFGTDGAIKDSGKTMGGATLSETVSADTLASEAAVSAAIDEVMSWRSL